MIALKTQAIQTALTGDWEKAISLNQAILQEFPDDIDTLNRIAYAYGSIGDIKQAKAHYQKVLEMDAFNPIASRNIKKLNGNVQLKSSTTAPVSIADLFIEESGKTKVVELMNIADKKTLSQLRTGERVDLSIKRMKIFVLDCDKQFVGMLPDDLSKRLIKFMEVGNAYEAFIKNTDNNKVILFVRETKRAARLKNQQSFVSSDKSKFAVKPFSGEGNSNQESEDDEVEEEL